MTTIAVSNASQLLSAIANRTADTVIVLNPGNYGSVSIDGSGSSLPINLQAASSTSASTFQYLTIANASGVTLTGLTFTPPSTGGVFAGQSLEIDNSTNILIQNNKFVGGATAFNDSASGFTINGSSSVTVDNNSFTGLTRGGIFVNDNGVKVTNNTLTNLRSDGFDFGTVNNVEIAYNKFSDFHPTVDDHSDGIQFMTVGATSATTNVNIHDNTMNFSSSAASSAQGIFLGNEANLTYQNITIQNNKIYTGYPNGIAIANVNGINITGNIAVATDTASSYKVGIHLIDASNATVASNITNALDIDHVSSGSVYGNIENVLGWTSNGSVANSSNQTVNGMFTSTSLPGQSGAVTPPPSTGGTGTGGTGTAPPVSNPDDQTYTALPGNQHIDGGSGHDTVTFNFKLVDATVSYVGNTVVIDSASSHTVLTGIETYVFTDGTVNQNDGDPLVDDLFYYSKYHDVWNAHVDADAHYHATGWHEGRDPNAFFSTSTYLTLNQDVKAAGVDPLVQYDLRGWAEGRIPSLAFDAAGYLANNPDVAAAHVDPLKHFLQNGGAEGRQPVAVSQLVAPNGFDYIYYLKNNPDVAAAGVDPYVHFETIGWKEGRNPSAYFDTRGYLAHNADVAAAGVNPLDQYHQSGWLEGRDPSVKFDTADYLAHHPEVVAMHADPLAYFLKVGLPQGQSAYGDGAWG
jgi:hypothetical protein